MKILIVKTSALGDIVHTFPVASFLRHHLPDAQIDWLVGKAGRELVEAHPAVDRALLKEELRSDRYDLLLDLQANCKSGLYTLRAKAKRKVGFSGWAVAEWPNVLATNRRFTPPKGENIRIDYLFLAASALGVPIDRRFASMPVELLCAERYPCPEGVTVVCPGSAQANKCLKEEELAGLLEQFGGRFLFVWGSEEERELGTKLSRRFVGSEVVPKLSLPALQRLMSDAELVVSMDSLPLHLCGTTTTPSLSLFGPSSAAKYAPIGEHHVALQGECPYGRTFEKRCPILRTCPTAACMRSRSIPPQTLDRLRRRRPPGQE